MDNELYCPMKMTSNPLGRCVFEKEKCAWWRQLAGRCAVWQIARKIDRIEMKMNRESMDDWISIRDGLPIDYQSVLIWDGCLISIAHREPGAPDNEFVDDYSNEFVYTEWWKKLPTAPKEA